MSTYERTTQTNAAAIRHSLCFASIFCVPENKKNDNDNDNDVDDEEATERVKRRERREKRQQQQQ